MGGSDDGHLEAAIAAQESLRGAVPDEIVDAAIAGLRAQLGAKSVDRRRRQATILFADVSGFTSMSESMDAELLTVLMDDLWSVLDDVVEQHGGRIDKHIGDALMAVWGAESSVEDDPERAVRAALRLQEALAGFRAERAVELAMRVGVNTGPVFLGTIGSAGEFTAMGDTVNVASRLEHAAPSDGVLVSHDTYRHVRGVFDAVPLPPLAVRGKTEPLSVYEIRAEKPRPFRLRTRGIEGVETSMVGRDRELTSLQTAFERCREAPGAVVVEVVGEAGIGKSRLLWEFAHWLELQPTAAYFFVGRAVSQRRSAPLALLRDVVANRFEILDSDNPSDVVAKLAAGGARVLAPEDAALLAFWLGFGLHDAQGMPPMPDGEQLSSTGRTLLARLVRAFAEELPVVVLIEDLHWADDVSLDVLRELLEGWSRLPLLVVATTRPSDRSGVTAPGVPPTMARRFVLEPLADALARQLAEDVLRHAAAVPAELVEFLVERSDGNAFYLEELVKMLIDDGAIDVTDEPWTIDLGEAPLDRIPPTLTGVLQARLDALPADARRALQHASIVGRIFWDSAVSELSDGVVAVQPALDRELIFPRRPSSLSGCSEFIFKHALLHEVVYDTVLLGDRPRLHAEVARWLDRTVGPRRDEYLIEIAGHWERADEPHRATELLESAAQLTLRSGDAPGCLEIFRRVVSLHRKADISTHSRLLVCAVTAHEQLGELEAARDLAADAVAAAEATGDHAELARALLAASSTARRLGDVATSIGLLDRAASVAEAVGGSDLGEALVQQVWFAARAGRPPDQGLVDRLLGLVAELQDPLLEARSHLALGMAAAAADDPRSGVRHAETALAISRRAGDRWGEAGALVNLGANLHMTADSSSDTSFYDLAERRYREALHLSEQLGLREVSALATTNLAQLELRRGRTEEAIRLARKGLGLARRIGSRTWELSALAVHAEALIAAGELETGLAHLGMVQTDPACDADELRRVLRRVGDGEEIRNMLAAGRELGIDAVAEELLGSDRSDLRVGSPTERQHHDSTRDRRSTSY